MTGYSPGYLNRIENNKRNPSMNTIEAIGHALEICPIRLLGGCHGNYCSSECFYYKNNFSEFPKDAQEEIAEFLKYMRIKYNLD